MTFAQFKEIIAGRPDGVVLLEGRRSIPPYDARGAKEFASRLARYFRTARFRSGNAVGSDQAFADGVAKVDASRLQIVAPYSSHRKSLRYTHAVYDWPESLPQPQRDAIALKTARASPANKSLIDKHHVKGALAAKASYLIRDTMKVTGHSEQFPKAICALFYVDPDDPMAGGTGHTIRVCQQEGVPVAFQDSWQGWQFV